MTDQHFKKEMDHWIKAVHARLTKLEDSEDDELRTDIDHDYELINELRTEIKKLKEEVSALRIVQLLHLKQDIQKRRV